MKNILLISFCIISLTAFYFGASSCEETPEPPKTLVEVISLSILEHPSDWSWTEQKSVADTFNRYSITAVMGDNESSYILENKKICIKLTLDYFNGISYGNIVSPDTLPLSYLETDKILSAYDVAINEPKRNAEKRKNDSLQIIEDRVKLDKEAKILSKLCK